MPMEDATEMNCLAADEDEEGNAEDDREEGMDVMEQQTEDDFAEIPELPTGQLLRFELLSPWDDPNFVGVGGIELFTNQGVRPSLNNVWTNAVESRGDLQALVDSSRQMHGENHIHDEGKMWLCNYRQLPPDSAEPIHLCIRFDQPQTLAMIRIWNYAGSRVHALRGVRNLRIWLDDQCIFQGEICCAFPFGEVSQQGDTILFTTNEEILAKIAEHDEEMQATTTSEETTTKTSLQQQQEQSGGVDSANKNKLMPDQQFALLALQQSGGVNSSRAEDSLLRLTASNRPTTGHTSSNASSASSTSTGRLQNGQEEEGRPQEGAVKEAGNAVDGEDGEEEGEDENLCVGKIFHIELVANWGCPDSIGLTGIQFLGPRFEPLNEVVAKECVVRCEPAEHIGADGLANLLNGRNLTCRPDNMWLMRGWDSQLQQPEGPAPMLSFTFPHEVRISGVSIWNYNASPELSYAGVRCARFYANGRPINGIGSVVLLRKSPGFVFFDFVQDILFDRCPLLRPLTSRPQTRSVAAFIFQLRLLSSWGDDFYIGLNGIELFNRRDEPIRLRPQNLAAFPESVNCLGAVHDDPRTSDKLIDGVNETVKAHHMWLTPILPNSFTRVFIIFDMPTFVTRIRIYNYRKTPERGVRHIALSADDLLLCSGTEVPMSTPEATGILDIPLRDSE